MGARGWLVGLGLLLGAVVPAPTPATADEDPFADMPDDPTYPLLDETLVAGAAARSVRVSIPPGGTVEVYSLRRSPVGTRDVSVAGVLMHPAGDPTTERWGTMSVGDFEMTRLDATAPGVPRVSHTELAPPATGAPRGLARIVGRFPAGGTYQVGMWTTSAGPIEWSRFAIRASAGVTVLNATNSSETFHTRCEDFAGGTMVSGQVQHRGVTASLDRTHTLSVDHGVIGWVSIRGDKPVSGAILGVDVAPTTGVGYESPDGTRYEGEFHLLGSALTGDYTFFIERAAASAWECGFVSGADITPA